MTTPLTSPGFAQAPVNQATPNPNDPARRAMLQQQREMMMLQRLQREAQPPKNRLDAVLRSAFDTTSVAFDIVASTMLTAGLAIYKGFFAKQKSWKWVLGWGLATIPATMVIRGVSAAFTGKAHGQEESRRMLATYMADANDSTSTPSSPASTSPSAVSSPLVNAQNTTQVPQTLTKPQSTLSVSG